MKIEVSNGEIVDKLTILEIKLEKITDAGKLVNVQKEYDLLEQTVKKIIDKIEERIREYEKKQEYGKSFVETARMVYFTNDLRAKIKHDINLKTGSDIIEEKSYEDY